jgi:hypothetical protein
MARASAKQAQRVDAALKSAKHAQAEQDRLGPFQNAELMRRHLEKIKRRTTKDFNYDWGRWRWERSKRDGHTTWTLVIAAATVSVWPLKVPLSARELHFIALLKELFPETLSGTPKSRPAPRTRRATARTPGTRRGDPTVG